MPGADGWRIAIARRGGSVSAKHSANCRSEEAGFLLAEANRPLRCRLEQPAARVMPISSRHDRVLNLRGCLTCDSTLWPSGKMDLNFIRCFIFSGIPLLAPPAHLPAFAPCLRPSRRYKFPRSSRHPAFAPRHSERPGPLFSRANVSSDPTLSCHYLDSQARHLAFGGVGLCGSDVQLSRAAR